MEENLSREEKLKKLKAIRDSEKNKNLTNMLSSLEDLDNYLSKYNEIDEVKIDEVNNKTIEKKIKNLISFFEKR
jgi:hypothetical protein